MNEKYAFSSDDIIHCKPSNLSYHIKDIRGVNVYTSNLDVTSVFIDMADGTSDLVWRGENTILCFKIHKFIEDKIFEYRYNLAKNIFSIESGFLQCLEVTNESVKINCIETVSVMQKGENFFLYVGTISGKYICVKKYEAEQEANHDLIKLLKILEEYGSKI